MSPKNKSSSHVSTETHPSPPQVIHQFSLALSSCSLQWLTGMAEHHHPPTTTTKDPHSSADTFPMHETLANSWGLLTLIISGGILLILTGVTVTATVLSLIFFSPILLISSPIWVPAAAVFFIAATGFLSMCGFGLVVAAALSWIYRYFRGFHPPGSDRFDYARSRMADTATHVKDYAREYGGYLHGKVKDAAPGA